MCGCDTDYTCPTCRDLDELHSGRPDWREQDENERVGIVFVNQDGSTTASYVELFR